MKGNKKQKDQSSFLHVEITKEKKNDYVRAAKRKEEKLNRWVVRALDKEAKK